MPTVNVRYIVDDVDAAVVFYTTQLGFELVMHPAPTFAAVSLGGVRLYLNAPGPGGGGQSLPDGRTPGTGRMEPDPARGRRPREPGRRTAPRRGADAQRRSSKARAATRSSSRTRPATPSSCSSRTDPGVRLGVVVGAGAAVLPVAADGRLGPREAPVLEEVAADALHSGRFARDPHARGRVDLGVAERGEEHGVAGRARQRPSSSRPTVACGVCAEVEPRVGVPRSRRTPHRRRCGQHLEQLAHRRYRRLVAREHERRRVGVDRVAPPGSGDRGCVTGCGRDRPFRRRAPIRARTTSRSSSSATGSTRRGVNVRIAGRVPSGSRNSLPFHVGITSCAERPGTGAGGARSPRAGRRRNPRARRRANVIRNSRGLTVRRPPHLTRRKRGGSRRMRSAAGSRVGAAHGEQVAIRTGKMTPWRTHRCWW